MRGTLLALSLLPGLAAVRPCAAAPLPSLPGTGINLDAAAKFLASDNPKDRAFGLVSMDYLGPKAEGYSQAIVKSLFDPSAEVRGAAAKALGTVNPAIAGPVVTLVNGQDNQAKLDALRELGKLGPAAAAAQPALFNFLDQATRPEDRIAAVNGLASVGGNDPQTAATLANLALGSPDPTLRKAALDNLGKMEAGPGVLPQFVAALNGANPAAQQWAIQGLGVLGKGNPEVLKAIKKVAASESASAKVREAAKTAAADLEKKPGDKKPGDKMPGDKKPDDKTPPKKPDPAAPVKP